MAAKPGAPEGVLLTDGLKKLKLKELQVKILKTNSNPADNLSGVLALKKIKYYAITNDKPI